MNHSACRRPPRPPTSGSRRRAPPAARRRRRSRPAGRRARATCSAVRSSAPSGSGSSTKSFSVPWPFSERVLTSPVSPAGQVGRIAPTPEQRRAASASASRAGRARPAARSSGGRGGTRSPAAGRTAGSARCGSTRLPRRVSAVQRGAAPARSRAPGGGRPSAQTRAQQRGVPRRRSPAAHIRRTRWAIRGVQVGGRCRARSGRRRIGVRVLGQRCAVNGRPVSSMTSSARTIRRPLLGQDARRPPGSTRGQPAMQRRRAAARPARPPAAPVPRDRCRELELVEHRPDVERRSRRPGPASARGRGCPRSPRAPSAGTPRRVGRLGHVQHVEQVVRDAAPLVGR